MWVAFVIISVQSWFFLPMETSAKIWLFGEDGFVLPNPIKPNYMYHNVDKIPAAVLT